MKYLVLEERIPVAEDDFRWICLSVFEDEDKAWEEISKIDPEGERSLGVMTYDPFRGGP